MVLNPMGRLADGDEPYVVSEARVSAYPDRGEELVDALFEWGERSGVLSRIEAASAWLPNPWAAVQFLGGYIPAYAFFPPQHSRRRPYSIDCGKLENPEHRS